MKSSIFWGYVLPVRWGEAAAMLDCAQTPERSVAIRGQMRCHLDRRARCGQLSAVLWILRDLWLNQLWYLLARPRPREKYKRVVDEVARYKCSQAVYKRGESDLYRPATSHSPDRLFVKIAALSDWKLWAYVTYTLVLEQKCFVKNIVLSVCNDKSVSLYVS